MRTRVQKWGDSLAVRIPEALAAEAGLAENTAVDLLVAEGRLVIQPRNEEPRRLEDFIRDIAGDNLHGEWEIGPAVGKEAW